MENIIVTENEITITGLTPFGKVKGVITKTDDKLNLEVSSPFGKALHEIDRRKAQEVADKIKDWLE